MMITQKNRLGYIILGVAILLLIPFTAMQFSEEVNWSAFDFLIMGILLLGVGLGLEYVFRRFKTTNQRLLLGGLILIIFFMIWAELAVGIFGTPFAGS